MKIFAEKVLGTVGWLSAICPLSGAMQPFYTTRGESRAPFLKPAAKPHKIPIYLTLS